MKKYNISEIGLNDEVLAVDKEGSMMVGNLFRNESSGSWSCIGSCGGYLHNIVSFIPKSEFTPNNPIESI